MRNAEGIFHEIKIMHTTRGPKRTKKKIGKKSHFSIVRLSLLVGIRIGGGGGMEATFSITPLRMVEKIIASRNSDTTYAGDK